MKKTFLLSIVGILCSLSLFAQNTTVTIKSNPTSSKNATLVSSNPSENYGNFPEFIASNNAGGATRSLIYFNLSSIPVDATIVSATLNLYAIPSSTNGHYGTNAAVVQRITTSWDENTASWSTPPIASTANQVFTAATSSSTENVTINVKPLIETMVLNSNNNQGFLFRLSDESGNKSVVYGSSTYSDSTKRPELVITYSLPQTTCVNIYMDNVHGANVDICNLFATENLTPNTFMLKAEAWTASGSAMITRALMEFYVSNEIPANAVINSANLYLFSDTVDSFHFHSQLSGSNDAYLKRVATNFDMTTVTWNNAPTAYATNSVFLPASNNDNQHYVVNVTQLLNDSRANNDTKFALLFGLNNENYYRKLQFLPGNTIYTDKRPYLKVCYSTPDKLSENTNTKSSDFSINPNPSNGILNVVFNAPFSGSVFVYDQLGNMVFQTTMNQESSKTIDLSSYANANYIVKTIAKDGATSTKKITVLK
jgi:hypothetical protein